MNKIERKVSKACHENIGLCKNMANRPIHCIQLVSCVQSISTINMSNIVNTSLLYQINITIELIFINYQINHKNRLS